MKLLYLHQYFSLPSGSTGTRSYEFSKHLVRKGHKVLIVTGGFKVSDTGLSNKFERGVRRGYVEKGIEVIEIEVLLSNNHSFFKRSWSFLRFILKTIPIVLKEKYDIIFATSTPLTIAIPGLFAKIFRKKVFIFEVRDLWPELPKAMLIIKNILLFKVLEKLASLAYKKADHIIGLSPGIIEGIKSYGISEDKITLIPNGCDNELFDVEKSKIPYGISQHDFVAIFSGTHGIANGLDILIPVAKELKTREISNIKLLLIGDGMLKKELVKKTKRLKLDNIIIFHDPVKKYELAEIFKSCDIGMQLLANIEEFYYGTSPNKFFDYISASLPVLNNYPGWLADIIEENDCGFVIPPEDPITFVDTLKRASENLRDLKIKGSNARSLAIKDFDRNILASQWVNKIENIYRTKLKL